VPHYTIEHIRGSLLSSLFLIFVKRREEENSHVGREVIALLFSLGKKKEAGGKGDDYILLSFYS